MAAIGINEQGWAKLPVLYERVTFWIKKFSKHLSWCSFVILDHMQLLYVIGTWPAPKATPHMNKALIGPN